MKKVPVPAFNFYAVDRYVILPASMKIDYSMLPTERLNRRTRRLDQMPLTKLLRTISREDARVPLAVRKRIPPIARAVRMITDALKRGGRLMFFGAGTSGRLGVLEAAECPPTFNTPPSRVQAFMAGGRRSVFKSREGAEDRGREGRRLINRKARRGDVIVGISASGVTAYVREALRAARLRGCSTILLTCSGRAPRFKFIDHVICLSTGPEVIAGSTRLKAGTATKLVLNMLTVGSMVRLGKVYGNRMVDLQPKSKKLVARAVRLIRELGNVGTGQARRYLRLSGGNAKTAVLMARRNLSRPEARRLLERSAGFLGKTLQTCAH